VEWRSFAPWISDVQVEQDLVVCRALISLFSNKLLAENLAFRGGTALHKLYLRPPSRYSEDIDLVQTKAGAMGPVIDAVREALDALLGEPKRERGEDSVTLTYRVESEVPPVVPMRLKVEINTREHFTVLGYREYPFSIESRWYSGACTVKTYGLDDLWLGLTRGQADPAKIVKIFKEYMKEEGLEVSRRQYRENLAKKMTTKSFLADTENLLRPGAAYQPQEAYQLVDEKVLQLL
jgi:hypothetical protein